MNVFPSDVNSLVAKFFVMLGDAGLGDVELVLMEGEALARTSNFLTLDCNGTAKRHGFGTGGNMEAIMLRLELPE